MEENQEVIPQLNIQEGKIVLSEIEVPIKVNGTDSFVKMRKLPMGLRNLIRKKYTKTSYSGKEPNIEIDETGYQEETLSKCIIEAPFDYSVKGIRELPSEVADYLFQRYVESSEVEKKNLGN